MSWVLPNIPQDLNIDFIGKRWLAFLFSILVTLAVLLLFFFKGLHLGVDFTGGIIFEVRASQEIDIANLRNTLAEAGYEGVTIQSVGSSSSDVMIRLQPRENDERAKEIENLKTLISASVESGNIDFRRVDYVGPRVGAELVWQGISAMLIALIVIMAYVWVRFDWQFGIGAVIALFHDIIAMVGFYLITGFEFDLTSIAAILTIVGYSINDSVVIFDRIRENLRKHKNKNIADIINSSLNQTLSRTIMTVATTFVACLALVLFGGEVIKNFSTAMLFGIVFGTYSSIYVSAPILLYTRVGGAQQ